MVAIESLNPEVTPSDSTYECKRTDNVFPPFMRLALGWWPFYILVLKYFVELLTYLMDSFCICLGYACFVLINLTDPMKQGLF